MIHSTNTLKRSVLIASLAVLWSCNALGASSSDSGSSNGNTSNTSNTSNSGSASLLDQALDNVSAMGTANISTGGDLTSTCSVSGNSNICLGTYVWSDDHSNDASANKGAIILTGNVQYNLVSNINVTTTTSPTATGVNTIGSVDVPSGGTLYLSNTNTATGFIGGF
ncbi:MAG: hypothetical protein P8Z00_19435 [Anaerolineales bacterium]|jgi:hypothetical protein